MAFSGKTAGMVSGLGVGIAAGVILAALNPILPRTDQTAAVQTAPTVAQSRPAGTAGAPELTADDNITPPQDAPTVTAASEVETAPRAPERPGRVAVGPVATEVGTLGQVPGQGDRLALALPDADGGVVQSPAAVATGNGGRDADPSVDTTTAAPVDIPEPQARTAAPDGPVTGTADADPATVVTLGSDAQTTAQTTADAPPQLPAGDRPADLAALDTTPAAPVPGRAQTDAATVSEPSPADTAPVSVVTDGDSVIVTAPAPQTRSGDAATQSLPSIAPPAAPGGGGGTDTALPGNADDDTRPRTVGTIQTQGSTGSSRFPQIGSTDAERVAGLTTGSRLPTIGDDTDDDAVLNTPADDPLPRGALDRNSMPFAGADRPLMSLVVIDTGDAAERIDMLKSLGLPLAVAVPADRADAPSRARMFRNAGFEVLALAPRDVRISLSGNQSQEQVAATLEQIFASVPDAMGLIDRPEATIQKDQRLTRYVVDSFVESGHGLITYSGGLNASARIAEQRNVPAGSVFRVLDAADPRAPVELTLNRAVMEARSKGQVIVMTAPDPETLSQLLDWAAGGRASSVAMAPVSAALTNGMLR